MANPEQIIADALRILYQRGPRGFEDEAADVATALRAAGLLPGLAELQLEHVVDRLLVAFLRDEPLDFQGKPIPDWVHSRKATDIADNGLNRRRPFGHGLLPGPDTITVNREDLMAPYYTDEATAIEHRLARATGQQYGRPPRHWNWKPAPSDVPEQP